MLSLNAVKNHFGDYVCRRCINCEYGADLRREDCRYGYIGCCPSCRESRNIVVGLRPSGYIKLWFKG